MKAGDVVVIYVRGRPRIAWYVGASTSGASHIVREKASDGTTERLVQSADCIALVRQQA